MLRVINASGLRWTVYVYRELLRTDEKEKQTRVVSSKILRKVLKKNTRK